MTEWIKRGEAKHLDAIFIANLGLANSKQILRKDLLVEGVKYYDKKIPSTLTAEQMLIRSGNIGSVRIGQAIGLEKFKIKQVNDLNYPAKPRWPLDEKAAFLLNQQQEPIGTRVFGPVTRVLRSGNFMKILSLAPEVL